MDYTKIDPSECEFYEVADIADLQNGERLFVEIDDYFVVILNIANNYFAIEDLCSHDNGPLGDGEVDEYKISCPRHGARFDVRSGKALSFPAVEDISAFPLRIQDGKIHVGFPTSK